MSKQKRARGRPKKNWMEGIRKAMNERNLNKGQLEDRKQWSLGDGQRRNTFLNRYFIYEYFKSRKGQPDHWPNFEHMTYCVGQTGVINLLQFKCED